MPCFGPHTGGNFKAKTSHVQRASGRTGVPDIHEGAVLSNPAIELLLNRCSAPVQELKEPAPSDEEIRTILTAASRVPDHGRLAPWRFIIFRGEARELVGEKLVELALKREPDLSEARQEQERTRFSRAPLVIGVVSVPREHPKVPQWEMFLSGGAAAMNLVLAANALGYSTNWITNWYSDDEEGRRILGLAPEERVVGFVHIGTFSGQPQQRPRPNLDSLVSEYSGPYEG